MTCDLDALLELIETWRDMAWDYQRAGRPELRDLTSEHADQLAALIEED